MEKLLAREAYDADSIAKKAGPPKHQCQNSKDPKPGQLDYKVIFIIQTTVRIFTMVLIIRTMMFEITDLISFENMRYLYQNLQGKLD